MTKTKEKENSQITEDELFQMEKIIGDNLDLLEELYLALGLKKDLTSKRKEKLDKMILLDEKSTYKILSYADKHKISWPERDQFFFKTFTYYLSKGAKVALPFLTKYQPEGKTQQKKQIILDHLKNTTRKIHDREAAIELAEMFLHTEMFLYHNKEILNYIKKDVRGIVFFNLKNDIKVSYEYASKFPSLFNKAELKMINQLFEYKKIKK